MPIPSRDRPPRSPSTPSPTSTAPTPASSPSAKFEVGGADQQQALFEASRAAWDTLPWPETLLSITWLASIDGQRALAYVQWRDDSEFEAYGRTHRPCSPPGCRRPCPG